MNSIFYNDDSQIYSKQSIKLYSNVPRTEIELGTIENEDRKDLTPGEAVRAWQDIESFQKTGKKRPSPKLGEPLKQAEKITGIGKNNFSKVKQVINNGDQELIESIQNEPQAE